MNRSKYKKGQEVSGGKHADKTQIEQSLPEGEEKLRILLTHASMGIVVARMAFLGLPIRK